MVKKVGKYELGRTLGEGTFGRVKHAINVETNEAVAIKVLDKESIQRQNMGNQIKKEISIMKMVKHKYVVSLIEVLASKTKIFIVLELVTGGELFDKIVQQKRLSEDQAKFYFCQLVEGVEYCHKLGVCHRDLKPENLLLDEHGNLKISDFGLSSLYVGDAEGDGASRTQLLHTTCGTPNYVAPEVLSDQGYDGKKADVWSIGVILYVLLAGFLPFDEATIAALFNKIKKAEFTYPSWFSAPVKSVIDSMLIADPKARISLTQLKEHPWLASSAGDTGAVDPPVTALSLPIPTELDETVVADVPGEKRSIEVDDDNDDDDIRGSLSSRRPPILNAFDIVSKSGGFSLDKLFRPDLFAEQDSKSEGTLMKKPSNVGIIRFGLNKRGHNYKFTSNVVPAEDLMTQVYNIFVSTGFNFVDAVESCSVSGRVKGSRLTARGMVGVNIRVYTLCSTLSLLEITKGKGDLLEWNDIYKDIVEDKLAHLINKSIRV